MRKTQPKMLGELEPISTLLFAMVIPEGKVPVSASATQGQSKATIRSLFETID
jgi:hypothetical protein